MNKDNYDKSLNYVLFHQNCISGDKLNNEEHLIQLVNTLISKYGWETLVAEWYKYLETSVSNRKEAFNFATWLFIYGFGNCKVKNPYPFLVLLYKKLELDKTSNDELDERFDTPYDRFLDLYVDVLISCKIINAEDAFYINPNNDKRFIEELTNVEIV